MPKPNDEPDLSLVPTSNLVRELMSRYRAGGAIFAGLVCKPAGNHKIITFRGDATIALGLIDQLRQQIHLGEQANVAQTESQAE